MKGCLKCVAIFCIFISLCVACVNMRYFAFDDIRTVKTFPVIYELCSPEVLELDVVGLQGIKVLDKYIVVSRTSDSGSLSIFSKDTDEYVGDFLKIGNGPGEILYAPFISWIDFSDDERYAYVYDYKGNYLEYDLSASIVDMVPVWNCLAEKLPVTDAARYFYIDENMLLCRRCKPDRNGYERMIVDCKGNVIPSPNVESLNEITSSEMNLLSTGFAINSKEKRIAEFGSRINVIHLYSYVDDYSVTLSVGDKMLPLDEWEQFSEDGMKKMYYDSKSFDKFFAALYIGDTIGNLDSGSFGTPQIQLFDWNGNPIAEIVVPMRALYFDIDIADKKLYVVDYETENIMRYDISEIFDTLQM